MRHVGGSGQLRRCNLLRFAPHASLMCPAPFPPPSPLSPGHSLGGAVATLCAVRLLDALHPELHPTLSCIGFAVPPVGNAALAATAQAQGWQQRITNYMLPEDWVPGLLSLFHRRQQAGMGTAASSLDGSDSGNESSSEGSTEALTATGRPRGGQPHERVCCGHAPSSSSIRSPGRRHGAAAFRGAAAAAAAA